MAESTVQKTFSSREINQDLGRAKRAAESGPVIITDRGKPAHVLMTFDAYQNLRGPRRSLADALAMEGGDDIEFDPPRMDDFPEAVDLS